MRVRHVRDSSAGYKSIDEFNLLLVEHFMCDVRFLNNAHNKIKEWTSGLEIAPKIAFDIGANVGLYSLMLAKFLPDCMIYAFEPVRSNFDILKTHVEVNCLNERIMIYNFGLWSKDTEMSLGMPKGKNIGNTGLYSSFHSNEVCVVQAQFRVLDSWCRENNVWPDFMKIDAEGAEFEILSSSPGCLSKAKRIITEYNVKDNDLPDPKLISSILNEQGFIGALDSHSSDDMIWTK